MKLRIVLTSLAAVLLIGCKQAHSVEPESAVAKQTSSVREDEILTVVQIGKPVKVNGITVSSADGRYAVFASSKRIVFSELATGKVLLERNLKYNPRVMAISPDNQWLAVSGLARVYLWNIPTKKEAAPFSVKGFVQRLVFSPDNTRLAISNHNAIDVVDFKSGRRIGRFQVGKGPNVPPFTDLVFSPDGRTLFGAHGRGDIYRLNADTVQPIGEPWIGLGTKATKITISADGRRLSVIRLLHKTIQVVVIDTATGTLLTNPTASLKPQVATKALAKVALPTGNNVRDLVAESGIIVESATFHPDSGLLVIGSWSGLAFVSTDKTWSTNENIMTIDDSPRPDLAHVVDVAISRDGRRAAAGPDYAAMRVYDVTTGNRVSIVSDSAEYANYGRPHTFLADGTLAVRSEHGIRIVDAGKGTTLRSLRYALNGRISVLAAGTSKNWIAIGTSKGSLLLARTDTSRTPTVVPQIHKGALLTIAFNPNDRVVATGGIDGHIRLFDVATGNPIGSTITTRTSPVTALSFSLDGAYIASGHTDGTVRVWNTRTGQPVTLALAGHTQPVLALMYDKSTGQLLSFGRDAKLRRWNIPR